MSDRQPRPNAAARMSSTAPLRRVRVMSSGRWHPPLDTRRNPMVVAVGAAQPGMGKSIVACNLAAAIAGLGRRVVVVDLDLRAPRQHALFGAARPDGGLQAWLERRHERREELAPATPVRNLRLLPCAAAAEAPAPAELRRSVLRELHDLDSEVV